MKAQRALELAQRTCWMNGRRSFGIRRDSGDALSIVRTCRTESEYRAQQQFLKLPLLRSSSIEPTRLVKVNRMKAHDHSFDSDERRHDKDYRRGALDPLRTSNLKAEQCSAYRCRCTQTSCFGAACECARDQIRIGPSRSPLVYIMNCV